jgi:hypothetical protein
MSLSTAKPPRAESSVAYNLGAITLAVVLGGLALAYAIDAASRDMRHHPHRADSETTLTRTLGGRELEIPLSWFRFAEQRVEGFAKQIDLQLLLPLGPQRAPRLVDVTLLPRSSVRPSEKLLDGVYLHMFGTDELTGPPGLVGKPLRAEGGYAAETVWYDPISADPFVAKCGAPVAPGAEPLCLRTVHLAPGIAAVYAFGADLLPNWRDFDPEMQRRLEEIGIEAKAGG